LPTAVQARHSVCQRSLVIHGRSLLPLRRQPHSRLLKSDRHNCYTSFAQAVADHSGSLQATPQPTANGWYRCHLNCNNSIGNLLFPVGSIYTNATNATNPGTLLGFGTWTAFGAGRVAVGFDAGNVLFDTAEETGGSADAITVSHTHTATVTDPGHTHTHNANISSQQNLAGGPSNTVSLSPATINPAFTGISVAISTTGSSGTNANYQPYITVYMWKRTA
jgi:hypothetical protein